MPDDELKTAAEGEPIVRFREAHGCPRFLEDAFASAALTRVIGHTTTDAGDLVAETRTVTIPAGRNSVNFSVANNDDVYSEVDESYSVSVTGTSGGGYEAQPANPAAITTTIVVLRRNTLYMGTFRYRRAVTPLIT